MARSPPPPARSGRSRIVDQPEEGHFLIRLIKNGPWVPARIVKEWGQWRADIDGKPDGKPAELPLPPSHPVLRIWHFGREITADEYARRLKQTDRPDPLKPVDLANKRSIF